MSLNRLSPFLLVFLFPLSAFAQSDLVREREVKSSGQYRWGEGVDADPARAEEAARKDLAERLYLAMVIKTESKKEEVGSSYQESFQEIRETYSALQLTGLDKIRFREGGKTRVVVFIDTADLRRSFDLARQRVRELVAQSVAAESERRIGDALRLTYWAYLATFTYLGDDTINFGLGPHIGARAALADRMHRLVKGISVEADPCYREGGAVIALVRFRYNGQPVENLDIRYYCGEGDDWAVVRDGQAYLTFYFEPSKGRWPLSLRLEYAYPTEMHRRDPEIEHLYDILKERSFDATLELELIAPWLSDRVEPTRLGPAPPSRSEPRSPSVASIPWSVTIQVLSGINDSREFLKSLEEYAEVGRLIYAQDSSQLGRNIRVFSAYLDEERVYGLIYHEPGRLIETRSGRVLSKPSEVFRGRVSQAYQIWIGEPIK